jgi:hypothetical protein
VTPVSVTADRDMMPDMPGHAGCLDRAFTDMRAAAARV